MPAVIRGVGRWIFLAIVLSISVHFLLYLAIVELPLGDFLARASAWKEKRVQGPRERIQISPDLLSETIPLPAMATHQTETEIRETDLTMVDQELDLLDAQENMPEKEVRLTPEVSDIHNFLKGEGSASAAAAASVSLVDALEAVATTASESLVTEDVSEIRRVMLEARGAVSENQLLLDISQLEEGTSPPDEDLFADLTAAQRAVSGGVPQLEGFDTLDNLLGRAGRLPGNLKPVLMPTDLLFGYNEDTLADSARLSLMKLGLLIQRNPESEFIIEGHTDSFGNNDYNLELSIRRATAVRDWLARSLRLSIDGIRIRGYGESRPLVDPEGSREAQQLNRRVEIVIRPKA
jgi:outer membrane protein OmpA-like peptidoglycan-associated protein